MPFSTFYPAVALAALYCGFRPGLLATVISAALADYFWMAPTGSFHLTAPWDVVSLGLFLATGALIVLIAERSRQANRRLLAVNAAHLREVEEAVARRTGELALAGDKLRTEIELRGLYEQGFRNIVEIAPQGILVVNADGFIELANANAERAFGYAREDMIGMSIERLVPERFRRTHPHLRHNFFEVPEARPMSAGIEQFGLRSDETEFPVEIRLGTLPGLDGNKVVATVTDISARYQVQQDLARNEQQMRLMFASISDHAIFMVDVDGRVASWNEGAALLKGYSADEIIGHNIAEFYVPEEAAAGVPQRNLEEAALHGRFESEAWRVRKDGTRFLANLILNAVRDASGGLQGFVEITRDVSERRLIQAELARSHERFNIAADASRLGFWDYDVASQTVQWDDWMYHLYGRPPMRGRQPLDIWTTALHPDERDEKLALLAETVAGRAEFSSDLRIVTPSGAERFLRAFSRSVRNADGSVRELVGVNFDITELKRAQVQSAAECERAEAANRSKSTFFAMMSHEIRTPMNAVIGMNALLCETSLDPRQRQLAEGARQSADMLLQIIDDMLDISKLDAGRLQIEAIAFNLPRFLAETMELLAPKAAEKGLALTSAVSGASVDTIIGDPNRLRQILLNLISNALKFTEMGFVSVNAHCQTRANNRLGVRIAVSDTGMGIDQEGKSRLFRPFEQMDNTIARRFGGSGLGLNICKHLVELMGGTIGVEDRPGGGTSFWFELEMPVSSQADANIAPLMQNPLIEKPATARILLAEDNEFNVKLVQLTLEPVGYTIDVALNGLQAVELAGQRSYDLILMDVQMPELDGLGATRLIRKSRSDRLVPIIAMTANVSAEDIAVCREAGMDDFLPKPCNPKRLREVVRHWIDQSAAVEAQLPLDRIATAAPLAAIGI